MKIIVSYYVVIIILGPARPVQIFGPIESWSMKYSYIYEDSFCDIVIR